MPSEEQFQRFVKERRYIQNVSPNTIKIYKWAWKYWTEFGGNPLDFAAGMRQRGKSAAGCNVYIRAMNAFLKWCGEPLIQKLKEPQKIPPTYSLSDVEKILKGKVCRAKLLVLLLLDAGLRIDEALGLRVRDIDFENLIFRIKGKGDRERLVPFSFELRKQLFKGINESIPERFVFSTKDGHKLSHRNAMRDAKAFLVRCGVNPPRRLFHSFRHTFAINYLRRGGSVFHLQRALGHSTLDMTRGYVNLVTEDLQEMQQKVSLLCR